MTYKYVYVKTFNTFASNADYNEFHFHDVKIDNTSNFLTIYDKDGVLEFRCHINDIAKFMREN